MLVFLVPSGPGIFGVRVACALTQNGTVLSQGSRYLSLWCYDVGINRPHCPLYTCNLDQKLC